MSDQKFIDTINEPYNYINKDRGKEIRVKLIEAFNKWTNISDSKLVIVKEITQKLHNASLLIDDIEDSSLLRRGNPCAHRVFGIPTTINTANLVYFFALKDTLPLGMDAVELFTKELIQLHTGQGMDIIWRDHGICPSESDYIHMVTLKTGGLFRLSIGLMQIIAQNNQEFTELVDNLSILFQILDDYLNLQSTKYHQNKSFCEDLTEGKFSFPIIHHVSKDHSMRVLNILAKKTEERDLKEYVLKCLKETDSFKYTLDCLKVYEAKIMEQIKDLGGNEALCKIVRHLMDQAIPEDQTKRM